MGKELQKNQEHCPGRPLAGIQVSQGTSGWVLPVSRGNWHKLLVPLYRRMQLWKQWHLGNFPGPVKPRREHGPQAPASRSLGKQERRVHEWVASIADERVRKLAFWLFVNRSSQPMGLMEFAGILGESPSWVGEKIELLLKEMSLLARGDNHSGELSA